MKGFRFRLEPVLRLRRHGLERRRLELARARVALRGARRLHELAAAALADAQADQADRVSGGLTAAELRDLQHGVEHLLREHARAAQAVVGGEAAVARALEAMTEARREVRALEILREKALDAHRSELARREQRELDEVAGRPRPAGVSW